MKNFQECEEAGRRIMTPDCISPPKSELAKRIHDLEADVERLSLEVEDLRLLLANVQVTLLKLKK